MAKRKEAICDSYCKGCVFNGYFNGKSLTVCEYFLRTGQLRPCPAGTGCTVKQTGNKKQLWRHQGDATWKNAGKKLSEGKPARRSKRAKKQKPPRTVYHRSCPNCGTEFDTTNKHKIYCCRRCTDQVRNRRHYAREKAQKEGQCGKEK